MAAIQKVALVTGAGTGIGRAVVLALARDGFAVVLAGRRQELLEGVAKEAGNAPTLAVPTDVSDPAAIKALFAKTKESFGRLDLLFNNAGIGAPAGAARRTALRDLEEGGRYQPDRRLPVHAGGHQDHEGAGPARRPHHQQRLDLGAHAAPALGRLYRDQARGHRPDQADGARLPRYRHHLRPDRYRQRGHPADRAHGAGPGRHAAGRPHDDRSAHGRRRTSARRWSIWRTCRSTPTCCS